MIAELPSRETLIFECTARLEAHCNGGSGDANLPVFAAELLVVRASEAGAAPVWMSLLRSVALWEASALRAKAVCLLVGPRHFEELNTPQWDKLWDGRVSSWHQRWNAHRTAALVFRAWLWSDAGLGLTLAPPKDLHEWLIFELAQQLPLHGQRRSGQGRRHVEQPDLLWPVLLVDTRALDGSRGVRALLRCWRVQSDLGDRLLVRAPESWMLDLDRTFTAGLHHVEQQLESVMRPYMDADAATHYSVAWALEPVFNPGPPRTEPALLQITGDSATASLALAAMVLLRERLRPDVPAHAEWLDALHRVAELEASFAITAAVGPPTGDRSAANLSLHPVRDVDSKLEQLTQQPDNHRSVTHVFLGPKEEQGVPGGKHRGVLQLSYAHTLNELTTNIAALHPHPLSAPERRLKAWLLTAEPDEAAPLALLQAVETQAANLPHTLQAWLIRTYAKWAGGKHEAFGPPAQLDTGFVQLLVEAEVEPQQAKPDELTGRSLDDLVLRFSQKLGAQSWLLHGPPGAGKSSILAHHLMEQCRHTLSQWHRPEQDAVLWVLLPMRRYLRKAPTNTTPEEALRTLLREQSPALELEFSNALAPKPGNSPTRRIALLLDGINELPFPADQQRAVLEALCDWLQSHAGALPTPVFTTRTNNAPLLRSHDGHWRAHRAKVQSWPLQQCQAYVERRFGTQSSTSKSVLCALQDLNVADYCQLPGMLSAVCTLMQNGWIRSLTGNETEVFSLLTLMRLEQMVLEDADGSLLPQVLLGETPQKALREPLQHKIHDDGRGSWRMELESESPLLDGLARLAQHMRSELETKALDVPSQQARQWCGVATELFESWCNSVERGGWLLRRGANLEWAHYAWMEFFSGRALKHQNGNVSISPSVTAIRQACRECSESAINDQGPGYREKYTAQQYVQRADLGAKMSLLLDGEIAPIMFVKAESGIGKTCFVRALYDELADSHRCIPMLIRGLTSDADPRLIHEQISILEEKLTHQSSNATRNVVDLIDVELQAHGMLWVILLDGVNEAKASSLVFAEARAWLMDRIKLARERGTMTSVRIIVTSRPERFNHWKGGLEAGKILTALKGLSPADRLEIIDLKPFTESELDKALEKKGITNLNTQHRNLLADPLLLGFYYDLLLRNKAAGTDLMMPRTPLGILQSYWNSQLEDVKKQADTNGVSGGALIDNIKKFCSELHNSLDSECDVTWTVYPVIWILVQEAMVFEQVGTINEGKTRLRFRYDRIAQLLIARYVWLQDYEHNQLDLDTLIQAIPLAVKQSKRVGEFTERDVIRGSIIAALSILFEEADGARQAMVFETAIQMLSKDLPTYDGEPVEIVLTCQLTLSEIVFDFLVEAARWHGPSVVRFLAGWFDENRGDEQSVTARALRKVVFCLLKTDQFGDAAMQSGLDAVDAAPALEKAKRILYGLGATALLVDVSGDPAVLLHALYRDNKSDAALEILKLSLVNLGTPPWLRPWLLPGHFSRLQRVCVAFLLLSPEAIADTRFLDIAKQLFGNLPSFLVAGAAAALADAAFNGNVMPVCTEAWLGLVQSEDVKSDFKVLVRLLLGDGWGGRAIDLHEPVRMALDIAASSKNAFITQLLSHAISCRVLSDNKLVRDELLEDLVTQIAALCTEFTKLDAWDLEKQCELGTAGYLLSLTCYHLIVFDAKHLKRTNININSVFELMYRLANEVLLEAPLFGMFSHTPFEKNGRQETSNIVGTLGRAALELGHSERFRNLVECKAEKFASFNVNVPSKTTAIVEQEMAFAEFLIDSLGVLGTLSTDPTVALDSIYDVSRKIGIPAFKELAPGESYPAAIDFESPIVKMPIKAMMQIRAIHPFSVETYLQDRRGKKDALPFLNYFRYAKPVELTRYLSWVFEQTIERAIAEHPSVVERIALDALENLTPNGLRVISARGMLRLGKWANSSHKSGAPTVHPLELDTKTAMIALAAAYFGSVGGPLSQLLRKQKDKLEAAAPKSLRSSIH